MLAELGEYDEAATIMRDHPPDAIAIIPGLAAWAQSAVDAAAGHHSRATELAIDAARTAAAKGAAAMAMNFLTDAARYGDARQAAAVLPSLGLPLDTDLQRVRAADVLARARRDPQVLLDAAEAQLAAGFNRHAWELAELARAADSHGAFGRRIAAVGRQAKERLGRRPRIGGRAGTEPADPAGDRGRPARRSRAVRPGDRRRARAIDPHRAEPPRLGLPQARHHLAQRTRQPSAVTPSCAHPLAFEGSPPLLDQRGGIGGSGARVPSGAMCSKICWTIVSTWGSSTV